MKKKKNYLKNLIRYQDIIQGRHKYIDIIQKRCYNNKWVKNERTNLLMDYRKGRKMDAIKGKYFSITDPKGVNTVIYKVNQTEKEIFENAPKYTVERLFVTEELKGDLKKKTFFVEEPGESEKLVILSFGKEKVIVNMGILENGKLSISKKPLPIKLNTLYSEKEMEYREFRYTPNLKRPISIIDPETTEEVKPVLYFDKETNEVRGKCKLKPYKSYFAFEIKEDNSDDI